MFLLEGFNPFGYFWNCSGLVEVAFVLGFGSSRRQLRGVFWVPPATVGAVAGEATVCFGFCKRGQCFASIDGRFQMSWVGRSPLFGAYMSREACDRT